MPVKKAADFTEKELARVAKFMIKQPIPHDFNELGIRFSLRWLQHVKTSIILLPLENMALYCDKMTLVSIVNGQIVAALKELFDLPIPTDKVIPADAITIGNLAVTALYCQDSALQAKAMDRLNELYERHMLEIITQFN